jgi:hypothetical protein
MYFELSETAWLGGKCPISFINPSVHCQPMMMKAVALSLQWGSSFSELSHTLSLSLCLKKYTPLKTRQKNQVPFQ